MFRLLALFLANKQYFWFEFGPGELISHKPIFNTLILDLVDEISVVLSFFEKLHIVDFIR